MAIKSHYKSKWIKLIETKQAGIELGLNQDETVSLELTNQVQNKVALKLFLFVFILQDQNLILNSLGSNKP